MQWWETVHVKAECQECGVFAEATAQHQDRVRTANLLANHVTNHPGHWVTLHVEKVEETV